MEQIEFEKNNSKKKPKLNIQSYNKTNRYILITYTDHNISNVYDTQFWHNEHCRTYLIDKETNLVFKLDLFEHFTVGMYGYGIVGSDCGDTILIQANATYRIGVENNQLKVQEIFRQDTIPGGASIRLADKYGNCIIDRYNNVGSYVLTKDNKLISLNVKLDLCDGIGHPGTVYRAVDGKIYNGNMVLNENGEFIVSDYIPEGYVLPSEALIYSDETTDYYFLVNEYDGSRNYFWFYGKYMIKVDKNSGEYQFSQIQFNVNYQGFQSGTYFYSFENDRDIIQTNIFTGEQKVFQVAENIIISSISVHQYNQISFTGINEYLQQVRGIVKANGEILYTFEGPDFETYFIQPLRKHKTVD